MINNCYTGFYDGISPDKRLDKRMEKIASDLLLSGSATVNKVTSDHASKTAFYRTLANQRLNYLDILTGSFNKCVENINVDHVLCIQDTTEFNFSHIANKLGKEDPDIGPTGNKKVAGLFCHPVLVCDPSGQSIYGLASVSVYNRKWGQKDKYERNFKSLPIEEKESFRWIENVQNARALISHDVTMTIIGDRESDIYDEFDLVANQTTHILVRSRADRRLKDGGKLYAQLEEQVLAGVSMVDLASNLTRDKRSAKLEIRYTEVDIKAPDRYTGSSKSIKLYAVEAKEINANLPADQKPIHWRLLTTHPIQSLPQALQCIEWYKQRWLIEELFRVLKTKDFQIESSQLGSGAAIKKLLAFTLEAALQIMRLKLALDKKKKDSAKIAFSDKQLILLGILLKKYEGNTVKLKNPYHTNSLAWAAWIIARIGKWTGYKSHGPPGYITLKNGYDIFNKQYELFELMHDP